jgi:tetratricopeptide (TPR) repeat protein
MIAGIPPFVGPTTQIIISRRFASTPPPLSEFREHVPSSLDETLARAIARSPADRWATVSQFAEALRNPTTTARIKSEPKLWQLRAVQAIAAALLIVGVLTAVFLRNRSISASTTGLGRVVVAPFDNRTGASSLDPIGVMAGDWITEGLQHTGLVEVVPTTAALQAARFVSRGATNKRGDPARALAQETGATTVVSGSYYRDGEKLIFRLDVLDRGGTRLLRTIANVVAPSSEPTKGVDEVRTRLMGWLALNYDQRLKEFVREGDQPPTYAAYQAFSEGMTKYIAVNNADAMTLFLRSYELDSTFTVGLLYASIAATNRGSYAQADSMLRQVNLRRESLSEYNRDWLDFRLAFVHGDHEAALAAIRKAAELAPESKAAYNHALKAYEAGYYHEALNSIEKLPTDHGAMRGFSGYWGVYASILHVLGLYDRELAVGLAGQKVFSYKLTTFTPVVRALVALHRWDSVSAVVRAAEGIPTDPIGWDFGHLLNEVAQEYNAHGKPDSAQVYFEKLRSWLNAANQTAATKARLTYTLYALGRFNEAQKLIVEAHRKDPRNPEFLGLLALVSLKLGDRNRADMLADSLSQQKGPYQFGLVDMYLARLAAAENQPEEAVARIRSAFAGGLPHNVDLHRDQDFQSLRGYAPFTDLLHGH